MAIESSSLSVCFCLSSSLFPLSTFSLLSVSSSVLPPTSPSFFSVCFLFILVRVYFPCHSFRLLSLFLVLLIFISFYLCPLFYLSPLLSLFLIFLLLFHNLLLPSFAYFIFRLICFFLPPHAHALTWLWSTRPNNWRSISGRDRDILFFTGSRPAVRPPSRLAIRNPNLVFSLVYMVKLELSLKKPREVLSVPGGWGFQDF